MALGLTLLAGCATSADIYEAACDAATFTIFVDMYHPEHVELAAVPGFNIVAPGEN
jgi:outer membrane murein-binding lipoprotein Lpp